MTLAATAVIGFGVALARSGENRRTRGRGRTTRPPRGRLGADEPLGEGLRRLALGQAEEALAQLAGAGGEAHSAVHDARKAIKRLRTIVRLLEEPLTQRRFELERSALRKTAALLSGARDAEVMAQTLDGLVQGDRPRFEGKAGVMSLRLALARDREAAYARVLEPANLQRVLDELHHLHARAAAWPLDEQQVLAALEPALRRLYRQGRRRMRRAAGKRGGAARTMHQWRKRVKELRYATEMLQREGAGGRRARERARRLRWVAKRADRLGEVLGEEHDLAVLGEWIRLHGAAAGAGKGTRQRLHKTIAKRRRKLRRRALREGVELYAVKPRRFARRAAKASGRAPAALKRR